MITAKPQRKRPALGDPEYGEVCKSCRRRRSSFRGRCLPCRTPADRRDLVEAGVPRGSADALHYLVRRVRHLALGEARAVLSIAHPALMENIRLAAGGRLLVRDPKYVWLRRSGWTAAPGALA